MRRTIPDGYHTPGAASPRRARAGTSRTGQPLSRRQRLRAAGPYSSTGRRPGPPSAACALGRYSAVAVSGGRLRVWARLGAAALTRPGRYWPTARANRAYLRRRRIACTTAEQADRICQRQNKATAGPASLRPELHTSATPSSATPTGSSATAPSPSLRQADRPLRSHSRGGYHQRTAPPLAFKRALVARQTLPLRTCCPVARPTFHQLPLPRHLRKHRRESLACARVLADGL